MDCRLWDLRVVIFLGCRHGRCAFVKVEHVGVLVRWSCCLLGLDPMVPLQWTCCAGNCLRLKRKSLADRKSPHRANCSLVGSGAHHGTLTPWLTKRTLIPRLCTFVNRGSTFPKLPIRTATRPVGNILIFPELLIRATNRLDGLLYRHMRSLECVFYAHHVT